MKNEIATLKEQLEKTDSMLTLKIEEQEMSILEELSFLLF